MGQEQAGSGAVGRGHAWVHAGKMARTAGFAKQAVVPGIAGMPGGGCNCIWYLSHRRRVGQEVSQLSRGAAK
jgi:hypothetical protein